MMYAACSCWTVGNQGNLTLLTDSTQVESKKISQYQWPVELVDVSLEGDESKSLAH